MFVLSQIKLEARVLVNQGEALNFPTARQIQLFILVENFEKGKEILFPNTLALTAKGCIIACPNNQTKLFASEFERFSKF